MADLISYVESLHNSRRGLFPSFSAGDTINVYVKIKEGSKERIQQYVGVVIQRRHRGSNGETITVLKIVDDVAVERIFPILCPNIEKIEVLKRGVVRRARLYYLRGLRGRSARIKEKKVAIGV